jgi:DNA-binding XRE family transcriptional regulator
MKSESQRPRLCWTRNQLVAATGLSYRTLINLEKRGLLQRIMVGINVACYTDASVQALFSNKSGKKENAA